MKKWLAAALCTAAAMSASSALAANINFVTAGTSSTFYPISATVCQLWNDSIEGMRATATPSGGGIDNLNQALDGEAQIGIANANLVYQAQQGTDSFEGYANENLRIFAGLYYNPNQVVVTRDSGIETLEDLVGKHISVGAAGSTTVDEATVHLALLGKTLDDLKAAGFWVGGASEHAEGSCWDAPFEGRVALVMGSEGDGISRLVLEKCDFLTKLPQRGMTESLNVAQATTALCFEWLRRNAGELMGEE